MTDSTVHRPQARRLLIRQQRRIMKINMICVIGAVFTLLLNTLLLFPSLLHDTDSSFLCDAFIVMDQLRHSSIDVRRYIYNHHRHDQIHYFNRRHLSVLQSVARSDDDDSSDNSASDNDNDDISSNQRITGDVDENVDDNADNDAVGSSDSGMSFDMAALQSRIQEVSDRETKLPLVVLDAMLPRQILTLKVQNELLLELIRDCLQRESPFVGMVGLARIATGQSVHLSTGVEVEIEVVSNNNINNSSNDPKAVSSSASMSDGLTVSFKARRRFQIVNGDVKQAFVPTTGKKAWTEGRVKFLDSQQQEDEEVQINTADDPLSVVRAITKAKEFTSPNMRTPNNVSLIDRWIELAKKHERQPNQIDTLLDQLGDIPPADNPSERAFWVGALINPLPSMGVALEIRPALLTAKTAEQRVEVAMDGIFKSIKHMDGSERLW